MPPMQNNEPIILYPKKLIEIAKEEDISPRTAQRRKNQYACIKIRIGKTDKFSKRYLDKETTEKLRKNGIGIQDFTTNNLDF